MVALAEMIWNHYNECTEELGTGGAHAGVRVAYLALLQILRYLTNE